MKRLANSPKSTLNNSIDESAHSVADHRLAWLIIAVLTVLAVVLVTHWPALRSNALTLDDNHYIQNSLIANPSMSSAVQMMSEVSRPSVVRGYYHPFGMISLMLDVAAGGRADHVLPFRITSLVLHLINSALVVVLLYLLFGSIQAAALAGLLFGVHPLTVEPVVWLGERKAVLAACFCLAAIIAHVLYAKRRSRWAYGFSLFFYVLGLLSKPTATPLPALLLLLDYWPLGRLSRRAVLEKAPFFVVALLSAMITVISHAQSASVQGPSGQSLSAVLEIAYRFMLQLSNVVWPAHLSPYHEPPQPGDPLLVLSLIAGLVLLAGALIAFRWSRGPLVGLLYFAFGLAPVMGVLRFNRTFTCDNYAYIPMIGLVLLAAAAIRKGVDGLGTRRIATCMAVFILVVGEAVVSRQYLVHWRDTTTLASFMVEQAPRSFGPRRYLGDALAKAGKKQEAVTEYQRAIEMGPSDGEARVNLGKVLIELGRVPEAVAQLEEAVRLRPTDESALLNLGTAYAMSGKVAEAGALFKEAIRVSPNDANARYNYAWVLQSRGDYAGAIDEYKAALRIQPRNPAIHNNYGFALAAAGRREEAVQEFKEALRLNPRYADARKNLTHVSAQLATQPVGR